MNDLTIQRRKFLLSSILGIGALSLNFTTRRAEGNQKIFLSESGNIGRDEVFGVGSLEVVNVIKHEVAITELREKHSYRTRLAYSNTDRYQADFLTAVMEYVAEQTDISFTYTKVTGKIKVKTKADFPSHRQLLEKRNEVFEKVLKSANFDKSRTIVQYKVKSSFGPSQFAINEFIEHTGYQLKPSSSIKNDLLQVSGLITGVLTRVSTGQQVSKKKQASIDIVTNAFGIKRIAKGKKYHNGRIKFI